MKLKHYNMLLEPEALQAILDLRNYTSSKLQILAKLDKSKFLNPRPTLCVPYYNTLRWLVGRLQMIASDLILNFMVSGLIIMHY